MAPAPCASMIGSAHFVVRKALVRLKSSCAAQSSSLSSTGPPGTEPPTLFTSTWRPPQRSATAGITRATWAPSVTSAVSTAQTPPSDAMISRVASAAAGSRSSAMTRAPSRAKSTAVARPLPQPGPTEPAPVINATLPSRRPVMPLLYHPQPAGAGGPCAGIRIAGRIGTRSRAVRDALAGPHLVGLHDGLRVHGLRDEFVQGGLRDVPDDPSLPWQSDPSLPSCASVSAPSWRHRRFRTSSAGRCRRLRPPR